MRFQGRKEEGSSAGAVERWLWFSPSLDYAEERARERNLYCLHGTRVLHGLFDC